MIIQLFTSLPTVIDGTLNLATSHYAEAEAAMIDHEGDIAQNDRKMRTVINDADIAEMYAETEPCTWQIFEEIVDATVEHAA